MKGSREQANWKVRCFLLFAVVGGLATLVAVRAARPLPAKPDVHHVKMVLAKQDAWLEKHPFLLRISRSQIAGVPGDLLTSACWHLMGAMKRHPRGVERPAQLRSATSAAQRG